MTSPPLGSKSPILSHFCIYNASLSSGKENSSDHILYYTSKKAVPLDVKLKHVGLAQALVNFTETFPGASAENVHSQKHRLVFLQPEPGFWMYICLELATFRKEIKDSKGKEKLVTEYLDTQLSNRALEDVLRIGYEQFQLLYGTFSFILVSNQQRPRALAHAIEEFFSEWIWKWDFDRLDTMCFQAVFNGVPIQSINRKNYLELHALALHIQSKLGIDYAFILNSEDGSLVYRSPDLTVQHIRSLRKLSLRRIEKQRQTERRTEAKKETGLKALTKTLSNNQFVNYFSSGGSKSTESTEPQTPSTSLTKTKEMIQGAFLSGLIESTAIGMNGEERYVTKADLVRVYLGESMNNYYLIIFKHTSGLVWHFLLSVTEDSEDVITHQTFYSKLLKYITEKNFECLSTTLKDDFRLMKEKR
ncbi:hypothetical protein BY458DRAFT_510403 [Sporodiniella umbellata]|nr:hypothetical protein BY458DRAFT_510403 [Sporodiniella umbellata]